MLIVIVLELRRQYSAGVIVVVVVVAGLVGDVVVGVAAAVHVPAVPSCAHVAAVLNVSSSLLLQFLPIMEGVRGRGVVGLCRACPTG